MATPYLIADSAQVTVLRSLASTAFGKYGLKLPEGVDLEDVYEVAAPGNELAYVSSLGDKRRVGGMFRRFVRADVNITAQGEDMVPASDVERVLDEAAKRVSGDFFLESDINKAGLGSWVPFVDFHVGDIANVEIWGRVVPLVVTRIEPKRTEHSDDDWSVHVGGQLLSDSEARLAENADIYNAVVSDRRELAGLDGKIRAETENRKSAVASESRRSDAYADSVAAGVESRLSSSFEASYERYSKALTQLGDTWRQELQKGLSAEQRARVEALRQEQQAREKAGTDLRGELEKSLGDAVAGEARARQAAIANLSKSFTTDLQAYGELVKEAKNYVDPATAQVVEFWSKENQNNFNKAVQLTLSAQAAYNDVNNIKWVSQDAWNEQQQKINEARAKFEEQQRLLDDAQSKQLELTKALTAANARAINLMNMQNHGSLYMTDTFVIKSGKQCNFSWSGRRGDMVGCHTGSVSDGGTYIKFDSPGDWQIYARVHFPPGSTSGTTTILRINFNDGHGNWSGATCTMYNKGWDQTHSCLMTVNVDNPNAYCYISGFASTTSGALGWTAPTGDQTTEFSVRQLSVKGLS